MKKLIQFMLVSSALLSASAFAGQYYQPNEMKHLYIGGGAGYGQFAKMDTPFTIKKRDGLVLNGVAGYRFNQYAAIQAEYFYLPVYKLDTSLANANTKSHVAALEAKATLPIVKQFNLFTKGGYTAIFERGSNASDGTKGDKTTVYQPIVGGGAEFMVTPQIGLVVQYSGIISTDKSKFDTVNMGTAGLNLYF